MSRFEVFTRIPLFKGVSIDDLFSILARISLDFESYRQGDCIAGKGDSVKGLLLLMNGTVSIDGQSIEAPAMLEYAHVYGNSQTYTKDIYAQSDCSTLCIDATSLTDLLLSSQDVLTNYLDLLSDEVNK